MRTNRYAGHTDAMVFAVMQSAQTTLWEASFELEKRLGFEIDTTNDFEDMALEDLINQFGPGRRG